MAPPTKDSVFRSMKRLYRAYIGTCRRKNIFWGLTIEEFHEITSRPCHYCGTKAAQISRTYRYNGIDRIDNLKGYLPTNVVPACKECNFIKSNRLSHDEMKVVAQALLTHRRS